MCTAAGSVCPICLETDDKMIKLECNHEMHYKCLEQHFIQECPICRRPQTQVLVLGKKPSEEFFYYEDDILDLASEIIEPQYDIHIDGPNYEFRDFDLEFINSGCMDRRAIREALYRLKTGGQDLYYSDQDYSDQYESDIDYSDSEG